jgi:predicted nucleic acid-binding protein
MGLILDSSVLVTSERQGKNARQTFSAIAGEIGDTEIGISVITLIELAHGAARADNPERKAKRERFIQEVVTAVPVHPVTVSIAIRTGFSTAKIRLAGCECRFPTY